MIYDYICPVCGKIKEVEHSIKESPEIICDCNNKMKIKISFNGGIHFKGKGFTKSTKEE